MTRVTLLALLFALLAACHRGEDHHIDVRDSDGQRLAAAFMRDTVDYRCEDVHGQRLAPGVTPPVPSQIFCRSERLNVDVHGTFGLHDAKVTVYGRSTLWHHPAYDTAVRLKQSLAEIAAPDRVTFTLGPTD